MTKAAAIILTLIFILFPDMAKEGAKSGITNGIFIIIPSIFPYIVISNIFIKTGAYIEVSKILYKPLKRLIRFDKEYTASYLISLFCGYPTGAIMAENSQNPNSRQAKRLFYFGNMPGFGFSVSFLGGLFGNKKEGMIIYLSFLLASLILNYISSFYLYDTEITKPKIEKPLDFSTAITSSIKEASISIISIIGFIVFFSSVTEIMKFKNEKLLSIVSAFMEITSGLPKIYENYRSYPFLICFFAGFSGLSIIFQALSFKKENKNASGYIAARLIFGITSASVYLLFKAQNLLNT